MSSDRINYLVRQYASNCSTDEEVEELFEWIRLHNEDGVLQKQLEDMAVATLPNQNYDPEHWESFIRKHLTLPIFED